jgi:outer membrane protein assembly factor BamA
MSALVTALLLTTLPAPRRDAAGVVASVRVAAPAADFERLSRYVEVKVGEPLRPDVVRHVVELFYATGEYEDVIVEAEPGPAGLDVVFRPIPAPRLLSVLVEGTRVISPGDLERIARLRPREALWPVRLERAAQDVAITLASRGYLEAQVTAAVRRSPGGADAVFTVRAGPRARVRAARVEGAGALDGALASRIRPAPGDIFRRERAKAAAEAMRRQLVHSGHWRAQVELEESYDPASGRVALLFRAQPGPLTGVEFQGAHIGHGLRATVEGLLRDGGLKADALEEAIDVLEKAFHRQGYRDVAVTRHEETRGPREVVAYEVRPGALAQVASVRVDAEVSDVEWPRLATAPGRPLRDADTGEDARRITRALEDAGHASARVDVVAPEGGGQVPVVFRAQPGPRNHEASVRV